LARPPQHPTPGEGEETRTDWAPSFPHQAIDRLLRQLEDGDVVDPGEARRLLGMVAREAQRLRATVTRLTIDKLAEADRTAQALVADAERQAGELRALGLAALESRLDEAERLLAAMRGGLRSPSPAGEASR
jgi:hypothetical protein